MKRYDLKLSVLGVGMQKRKLGNLEVPAIGLGCMSMSFGYGPAGDKAGDDFTHHNTVHKVLFP
jgi:aryl-alcohol dehydrogenase-like predicted oxidoreductase